MIEKQRTTPDVYPLSLNALRVACNQTTNRDPVVEYDEETIRAALRGLGERRWARPASSPRSRAVKFRHLLDDALGVGEPELAVLGVLMLRGAQTPGELKGRTDRLHSFGSLAEIHELLEGLIQRELVARLPRRPGQKEERYTQLLGGADAGAPQAEAAPAERDSTQRQGMTGDDVEARLSRLEDEVASLRQALESLRADDDREALDEHRPGDS